MSDALTNAKKIIARPLSHFPAVDSRTADKFVVRLPDGMRDAVGFRAKGNHRSMNSEIISTLDMHLRLDEMGHGPLLEALLAGAEAPAIPVIEAPKEGFRFVPGEPVSLEDAPWIFEKANVKGNIVYAELRRENPANGLDEERTVRYSAIQPFFG